MVPTTEKREVRERGRPSLGPVAEMMTLPEADGAAREAAAVVPMMEGSPQGGWNRPRSSPNFE